MATIYGNLNPPSAATYVGSSILNGTGTGADGDVFVRTSGVNPQWRFSANPTPVWTPIVPPTAGSARTVASDTRADTVPRGGDLNDRLSKVANLAADVTALQPWSLGWLNAADGVVIEPIDLTPASLQFTISHNLGFAIVDVEVIDDDGETVHYPEVTFDTEMRSILKFRRPVAGKVVIRR